MKKLDYSISTSSFRDPSGFVFKKNGIFFRQINKSYRPHYEKLVDSGLFKILTESRLMINHREITDEKLSDKAYKIIQPEQIPFISYPYEWCFGQLKDAALLTLKIQSLALKHDMILKDASAYNIQFVGGAPLLIDTLSFEQYKENKPWVAYRQFCQHFLAPLALLSRVDIQLGKLSQIYLDGIPLDLAVHILPTKTKFSLGLAAHLHLHARSLLKHANTSTVKTKRKLYLSKSRLLGIIDSLGATINSLKLPKQKTEWMNYYEQTNYTFLALQHKKEVISRWIFECKPQSIWDAGANDGNFSRLASHKNIFTLATDIDPLAIESAYQKTKEEKDTYLLPLILDLTNPSPTIGWFNQERTSFLDRFKFEMGFCLAFIHHLAIANNLPLPKIAEFFSQQINYLCIEFIPKEDSNAQRLLVSRDDIFPHYNQTSFEKEFAKFFHIKEKVALQESKRILYLMQNKYCK